MLPSIRIAMCDDARAIKILLGSVIEEEGDMEVVSSTSTGRAALGELARQRPEVLLLDLLLPDVPDPAQLVREIRACSPGTAILLMSNMPGERLRAEARRIGADACIAKAHKPDELRAALRTLAGAPSG